MQILPRHLAGPGAVDPRTAWAFPFDEGWIFGQAKDGTAAAFSPCLRLQTTFHPQPEKPRKGTWTIGMYQTPFTPAAWTTPPTWAVTFDATTPVEILRDVHTELLDLYLEDRPGDRDRLFEDETAAYEAYVPLLARGWSHDPKTDGTQTFLTREGLGGIRHQYAERRSGASTWLSWGGYPDEPNWKAHFSFGTPTTLVAAFTASLVSTEPLHRTVQDVPAQTRSALYIASTTANQLHGNVSVASPPPARFSGRHR
ncbi:DUF317 domain-containing protein [Streptomyces sp. SD11]|uniref:DUF317 domain-containing protein n=1 Tax=Streptomyces sp. SD11 TaxID=3452209 RepID=UPI003F88EF4B